MNFSRRNLLGTVGSVAALAATGSAFARGYPDRPITLVVPYPPGASTDETARLVAQQMQSDIGETVIVENRSGAAGNIGAAYVAKSTPDGYRFLLATQPILTINPYIYKSIGFDPNKGLVPLTCGVNAVVCIAAHPSAGVNSIAELIAFGKANPGKLNFGTAGTGSPQHIGGLLFAQRAGFEWTPIPYRGGGPMVMDLVSGQIKFGIVTLSAVEAYMTDGRLKILAIGEKERFSGEPSVPTISETLPGFELTTWLGFFGPGGLPAEQSQYLSKHIIHALNDAAVKSRLLALALLVHADGPAALAQLVASDRATYMPIIRKLHITAD